MPASHPEIRTVLFELETELRCLALWQGVPPSPQRLASAVPFCHDTLEFHEWLQWVFIPRLGALLDAGRLPPFACQIAPLAELTWERQGRDVAPVIARLARLDALLGDPQQRGE